MFVIQSKDKTITPDCERFDSKEEAFQELRDMYDLRFFSENELGESSFVINGDVVILRYFNGSFQVIEFYSIEEE